MKCKGRLLTVLLAVFVTVPAVPALAELGVGDAAPPLSIVEWVKGDPVDLAKDVKKRFHVIEFWATWCPPCKMSVPLLTELQKKYKKDILIIGVTEPDAAGNSPRAIRDFVKSQGDKMDYSVAIDSGKTTQAYLAAAGADGIPHAFVVDKSGMIVWQGSPLDPALDTVLGDLVGGKFDLDSVKREQQVMKRFDELNLYAQMGQWQRVWDGLVDILKLDPANETAMGILRDICVQELRNTDTYRQWARAHIDAHHDNANAMARLATTLCMVNDIPSRFPDLALEAAKAANEATGGRDATTLAVYARAMYQIGKLDRAIALSQDAVALADGLERDVIKGMLDYYRTCKKLYDSTN